MTYQREARIQSQATPRSPQPSDSIRKFRRTNKKRMEPKMRQAHDQLPDKSTGDRFQSNARGRPSASHNWLPNELVKTRRRPYRHSSAAERRAGRALRAERALYENRLHHLDSAGARTEPLLRRRRPEPAEGCGPGENDILYVKLCSFFSTGVRGHRNQQPQWLRSTR